MNDKTATIDYDTILTDFTAAADAVIDYNKSVDKGFVYPTPGLSITLDKNLISAINDAVKALKNNKNGFTIMKDKLATVRYTGDAVRDIHRKANLPTYLWWLLT